MFSPCIVIPVYKHTDVLAGFIGELKYPLILVDDGNPDKDLLRGMAEAGGAILIVNEKNFGKGYSVMRALDEARARGYTHALQLDADHQHDLGAIESFLSEAEKNPAALINSYPVYDETIPPARLYGRRLTNLWVHIETRSCEIKDAMCGFRVYPLKETSGINTLFNRMGFDIEILVKASWKGLNIINLPVNVRYPEGGHSNFRVVADNIKISFMHTYLFCASFFMNNRNKNDGS